MTTELSSGSGGWWVGAIPTKQERRKEQTLHPCEMTGNEINLLVAWAAKRKSEWVPIRTKDA